jgi:lipopolysaccharide biosynthesis protein
MTLWQFLKAASARIRHSVAWHFAHSIIGHLRRLRSAIRRRWPGQDPAGQSRSHAVYAHYDAEGVVHDYVVDQIRQLADAGFRVTFVSNARKFNDSSAADVAPFCRQVIWRRNVGYDFGAYKDGIGAIGDLGGCDRLLLMNDSVYGPFWPFSGVFDEIDALRADFCGITDSWDKHYHVQSYFIVFFRNALSSGTFGRFWRHLPYVNSKSWVIRYGEIKLTQRLTQRKLRAAALCPYWEVARVALKKLARPSSDLAPAHKEFLESLRTQLVKGSPLNPMHHFWEVLVTDFRCPFIKREVILSNPVNVVYSWRWPEVIADNSGYDIELIRRHLQSL